MGIPSEQKQFDCLAKLLANPSMPHFILLATDPLAPKCVRDWGARKMQMADRELDPMRRGRGISKAAEAFEVAGRMEAWKARQDAHAAACGTCMPLPFMEGVAAAWNWLTSTWLGGVACGATICLGTFAMWVTR
jgi:hypothetical protein